nr:hypothetical protein [Tanacetum cinerariifolium]
GQYYEEDDNDGVSLALGLYSIEEMNNNTPFLLHHHQNPILCLVNRELVDVPWHVTKFLCDKAKGVQKNSKSVGAHLIRRIARSLGLMSTVTLRLAEIVDDKLDDSDEEADVAKARRAQ